MNPSPLAECLGLLGTGLAPHLGPDARRRLRDHGGRGLRGRHRRLPDRPARQGRDDRGIGRGRPRRPRADDAPGTRHPKPFAGHLRDRRRRGEHGQRLDGGGDRGGVVRRCRGQARQPLRLGQFRQRRGLGRAWDRDRGRAADLAALPLGGGDDLPLRAEVPPGPPVRRPRPQAVALPDLVQSGRARWRIRPIPTASSWACPTTARPRCWPGLWSASARPAPPSSPGPMAWTRRPWTARPASCWSRTAASPRIPGTPCDFGLPAVSARELRVSGPADSADRLRKLFDGAPGPVRAVVLANSAAALWVAGRARTLREGVALAAEALDTGACSDLLARWGRLSRGDSP